MRLWSLHPRYLDSQGLVALWREALLAQKVLAGETKGYRFHPQLDRFRKSPQSLSLIGAYLYGVWEEANTRGYNFDFQKIRRHPSKKDKTMTVSKGQLTFEWERLKNKLKIRDPNQFRKLGKVNRILPHPLFKITHGDIASWEKTDSEN